MGLNIFDDIGHLRYWVDHHKGGINTLWNKVEEHSGSLSELWNKFGEFHEKFHNGDWGAFPRIENFEKKHFPALLSRLGELEAENRQLKEDVRHLKELAAQVSQLEVMLINAVNQALGNK